MTKQEIIAFYTQWFIDNSNELNNLSEIVFDGDVARSIKLTRETEALELTNDLIRGFVDKFSVMAELAATTVETSP